MVANRAMPSSQRCLPIFEHNSQHQTQAMKALCLLTRMTCIGFGATVMLAKWFQFLFTYKQTMKMVLLLAIGTQ